MSSFEGSLVGIKPESTGVRRCAPSRFLSRVPGWKTQKLGRTLNVGRSLKVRVQTPGIVQEDTKEVDLCEEPSPGSLGLVQKEDAVGSDRVLRVFLVACSASIMAAVSRTSFSVLAIPIQERFALSMADMGLIQSSLLFGYIVGQVLFLFWCELHVFSIHKGERHASNINMMFLFKDARANACRGWQMHRHSSYGCVVDCAHIFSLVCCRFQLVC